MLFNSPEFIFLYLPVVICTLFLLQKYFSEGAIKYRKVPMMWLILSSLVFYGWWNPSNLLVITFSIAFNFSWGLILSREQGGKSFKSVLLTIGILANISIIAYFKYSAFIIQNINFFETFNYPVPTVVLPLAISFFTFQQVAYLVDAFQGKVKEHSFINYIFFVTFFPQLIAGPIVHHKVIRDQVLAPSGEKNSTKVPFAAAIAVFVFGLFKKVVLADNIARFSTPVFAVAASGIAPSFAESWIGAISYTLQLYFDFSGYSDMAIGLGYMCGIRLPINFDSPYKAISISDFWRRWHITLSNFLRDYLYIPLGGSRKGPFRRHLNLLITMIIGGLWHGAGWNFVFWGGLHGFALIINHQWRVIRTKLGQKVDKDPMWMILSGRVLTFIFVVFSWVYFRADSFSSASLLVRTMSNFKAISLSTSATQIDIGLSAISIGTLLTIVWIFPNVQEIMGHYAPAIIAPKKTKRMTNKLNPYLSWAPNNAWCLAMAVSAALSILSLSEVSEFLYFRF